jgi:hypothetical protein
MQPVFAWFYQCLKLPLPDEKSLVAIVSERESRTA